MKLAFIILAALTASSAIAAMTLRNLIHCALFLVLTFAGLAGLYLQLDAQFIGLVQVLVYIGAVAILIVFAILLTRARQGGPGVDGFTAASGGGTAAYSSSWIAGVVIAVIAFVAISGALLQSSGRFVRAKSETALPGGPQAGTVAEMGGATAANRRIGSPLQVETIGRALMTEYVLPLEVMAVLLTAAMIGAVVISMPERRGKGDQA